MLTIQEVLGLKSNLLENSRVKLVRHKDSRVEYRDILKDKQVLLDYQKEQPKDVFGDCDYIVSFIGKERKRSILFGVFKVNGVRFDGGNYHYDLQSVPEFDELVDRMVIDWGDSAISWHQWYDKQAKEVVEILPKGYIGNFPGLLNFALDFHELKRLVDNPEANFEWKNQLSAISGIYIILDSKTGQQYIGSANGAEGVWQRWSEYAKNYTGDNKELKSLIKQDPSYYHNFRYSILQTLPSNTTTKEIVAIESLYKDKLGSKVYGLNRN